MEIGIEHLAIALGNKADELGVAQPAPTIPGQSKTDRRAMTKGSQKARHPGIPEI